MMKTTKAILFAASLLVLGLGACTDPGGSEPNVIPEVPVEPGTSSGNEDTTFDHPDSVVDPFEVLEELQQEGPPRYSSRVHSCPKMRYATIGRVLASRGINLGSNDGNSAGSLYRNADQSLGAPNYNSRVRENIELTTASATKLFDIFVQAAPEMINTMPNRAECTTGGQGTRMFNASGQCTLDGISCIIGVPATAEHVALCNQIIQRSSDQATGQVIAVAALSAAAHTCE